jgi:hypothetical protein
MKNLVSTLGVLVIALSALAPASRVEAQQPKLDIKALAGFSVNMYDTLTTPESLPEPDLALRERYPGWLGGFGARISKRNAFAEALFTFNRFISNDNKILNSFQLPINLGYIPFKIAEFGIYLYGGYVNHFNVALKEGKERKRIKGSGFVVYQALARFGVSFDLYMFNFDFNYSIGLNSATKTPWRTRYQLLQFTVAYVF